MGTTHLQSRLQEIIPALIACKGLQEFDHELSRALVKALVCDVVGFYLYSKSTNSFSPVSTVLTTPDSPGYLVAQLPGEGTMKEAAVERGSAVLENDLARSSWTEASILRTAPFTTASALVAPLMIPASKDRPAETIAVVAAITIERNNTFTEDHRLFLECLAAQAGSVLQNVLASEERDALMAMNRQVLVGSTTISNLIPLVRDILHGVVRHDMTGLVRFTDSPQGTWFDILYREGVDIDLARLQQFPFEQMAPAELLATGKPLLITGHNHTRFAEHAYIESVGILSCMLCPLHVQGKPYGFLAIGSKRRNAFADRDLAFAEQIGFHLSQAITNLTAYEEIRSLKEQLEHENLYLRDEITASADLKILVGESPALQKTLIAIEQVAPTDSTVLITGETGTGKELVAQAIHRLSLRKDKPLITINCAALPPTLIESELFGHERGAFTSATARKVGRFELADGGTILLDEIGELPLELQAKFLRVLESQELHRVGGTKTITLNVRVVAATNTDLQHAVTQGTFRADLFYRLNVFPVRTPSLRERREDIPILARHFVKKYGKRHRKPIAPIASSSIKALVAYDWPGNVRELEHVIERAVIINHNSLLVIDEFEQSRSNNTSVTSSQTLADAERVHILEVLKQTNGILAGKHGAAVRLGMKRSTLQHRMKKLGIRRSSLNAFFDVT